MTTIRIPRLFWDDHQLRADVNPGREKRRLERFVEVDLTDVQRADLREDAEHHVSMGAMGAYGTDPVMRQIVKSAERTVAALDKAASA